MTDSFVRGAQDTTDRVFTLVNLDARRPEDVLLSKKITEVRNGSVIRS